MNIKNKDSSNELFNLWSFHLIFSEYFCTPFHNFKSWNNYTVLFSIMLPLALQSELQSQTLKLWISFSHLAAMVSLFSKALWQQRHCSVKTLWQWGHNSVSTPCSRIPFVKHNGEIPQTTLCGNCDTAQLTFSSDNDITQPTPHAARNCSVKTKRHRRETAQSLPLCNGVPAR